jgi:2'-5' RNA ligase
MKNMQPQPQPPPANPPGTTAIIIVPPLDIRGFADHYRRLYMPETVHRIEPHITVVCPFVPYARLPQAMPLLKKALASVPPRPVALRGFAVFPDEGILYLRLANDERVHSLYRAILAEFPEYPAYGGKYGDEWVPHMTVGEFTDRAELEQVFGQLAGLRLFLGWDVEQVTVKYKAPDGVWHTWAEVPLGGGDRPEGGKAHHIAHL